MTARRRACAASNTPAVRLALAGLAVGFGALVAATPAAAQPGMPPVPPAPAPGAPVAPPPPGGPPPVPQMQMQDQKYGSGDGPLGFLRDAWNQAKNPYGDPTMTVPGSTAPPPGAGPAPALPPGYTSISDPGSSTPAAPAGPKTGGPPLPEGYYPLDGPPPPGYFDAPPAPAPGQPGAPAPGQPAPPAPAPMPPKIIAGQ